MPRQYDNESGYLITCFSYSQTVVPSVLKRVEFWLFFAFHLSVYIMYRFHRLHGSNTKGNNLYIEWNEMKVIGAITTFFEVFYTNQCFSRYLKLHHLTRTLLGTIYDYAFELKVHMGDKQQNLRMACRCFTAAIMVFFYEMNNKVSEREWHELLRLGLLKEEERKWLLPMSSHQRYHVMMQWAAEAVKDGKVPANIMKSCGDKIIKVRGLQQEVMDTVDLPIPFQYFHLLRMMVVVNLLLWAYGMGVTESIFAPVVYFCAAFIFMGMMELAAQLSDPFGDDEVDFALGDWLEEFLENMVALVEYQSHKTISDRLADEMALRQEGTHLQIFMQENMSATRSLLEDEKGQANGWWRRLSTDEHESASGEDDGDDE